MKKIEIESKIANKRKQIEKIERRLNKHLANPHADPYDIRSARYDLQQANATLAKYMQQLHQAELDESLPEIPVIRTFLERWETGCIEWHNREVADYLEKYDLARQGKFAESVTEEQREYLAYRTYGRVDDYKLFSTWARLHISDFAREHTNYHGRCLDNEGIQAIRKERDNKYVKLLRQVLAITGEITDVAGLRIGAEGDINGIIVGEKGKASVNTFGAGGWNIQCFHFRTTVKEVR